MSPLLWLYFNVMLVMVEYARSDLHPMLYFSQSDVQRLRIQATFSHSETSRSIQEAGHALVSDQWKYLPPKDGKSFTSGWNEQYGNNLCAFSFYCILYPDDRKAFELVKTFLDRMESYKDWYVGDNGGTDIGPISHTLTGFATAYDLLYQRFDTARRKMYYSKIKSVTSDLYKIFSDKKFEFMQQYTHSQASTTVTGFLHGALVVSTQEPEVAAPWLQKAQDSLDFTLELFSYVVDGSSSEGVSYGSYTSRALTQYVYLAKRHFNKDHTQNPWLQQHLWFYYHTVLPGFQRAVGIADSNYNWLYGPESQILFLDSQVLKSGYGNWLAKQIQVARVNYRPLAPSSTQIWSSHHTEFLFYNSSIASVQPGGDVGSKLHVFSDWGVVTLGGSQALNMGSTYFSFKCGTPGGEAARDIIHNRKYVNRINGWENFKPGHEHPDHNSFVFIPNGRYVISEALHGPKLTYLDNSIVFSPSPTSLCNQPWEGQLGECERWLKYDQFTDKTVRGEILTAASSGPMSFVAGEAVAMYSKAMRLSSVQRSILHINPEVLIIVDSIRLQRSSPITQVSAFFHNTWTSFKPYKYLGYHGAKVEYPEGDYSFFSIIPSNQKINISIQNGVRPIGLKEGPTNYVNVTFDIIAQSQILYIFHGPTYTVGNISIEERPFGIMLNATVNGKQHEISIASISKSLSRDIFPTRERRALTGFSGFATVVDDKVTRHFGLVNEVVKQGEHICSNRFSDLGKLTADERTLLPRTFAFTSSFDGKCDAKRHLTVEDTAHIASSSEEKVLNVTTEKLERTQNFIANETLLSKIVKPDNNSWKISIAALIIVLVLFFACKVHKSSKRDSLRRSTRTWQHLSRLSGCLLLCMTTVNLVCIGEDGTNVCFVMNKMSTTSPPTKHILLKRAPPREDSRIRQDPFIMVTSLPGSGVDVLKSVFENIGLLTYIPSSEIDVPVGIDSSIDTNPCVWTANQDNVMAELWFRSMIDRPTLHFNQQAGCSRVKRRLRQSLNTPLVLNDNTGFWTTKMQWISNIVGHEHFQPIIVVRDPRSWIHMLLSKSNEDSYEKTVGELTDVYERLHETCSKDGSSMPLYARHFREEQTYEWHVPDDIEKLAMLWTIVMGTAMANAANESDTQWPLHVIRFEDIVTNTEDTITNVFLNLGFPLPVKALNEVTRVVTTGHYSVAYDGIMNPHIATSWKSGIAYYDIKKIEKICGGIMEVFGYINSTNH